MNRNDDRDIYRAGANGIGSSYGDQGSSEEERIGRERSREPYQGAGQRSNEYGSSRQQGGYGQGSSFGRDSRDSQYGRDYGMSRDYGRDFGRDYERDRERDFGYGSGGSGYGRPVERGYGRDFGGGVGRERDEGWTGRDRGHDRDRDREHGWWARDYERPGFRGRDEEYDFWGRPRHEHEGRGIGERIGGFFHHEDRDRDRYESQQWGRHRQDEPGLWDKVKGAFTGKGPKGYMRSDDRIREDVCERLTYHPYVDASDIEVQVLNGEVTLMGFVEDRNSKRLAEDIVEDIRGVKDVHNQIRVKSQFQTSGSGVGVSSSGIGTSSGAKR